MARAFELYASVPVPLAVVDARGRLVYANELLFHMLQYTNAQLLDQPIDGLLWPSDRAHAAEQQPSTAAAAAHGVMALGGPFSVRRGDGTELRVEIAAAPLGKGAEDLVVLAVRDLALELRAQEALRRSEERARSLLHAAPDAWVVVTADMRIVQVNRQAVALFGFTAEELVGQTIDVLLPERLRERHSAHVQRFVQDRLARPMGPQMNLVARCRSGEEIPVEIALGRVTGPNGDELVATIRDQRERRGIEAARAQAEASAQRARDDLAGIVENVPDNVFTLDEQGTVLFVNRTPPLQGRVARGSRWTEDETPASREALDQRLARVLATGQRETFESRTVAGVAAGHWFESTIGPIVRDGVTRGAVVVSRDVSERKRLEEHVATSDRMASMGLVAAGVAHEINNPLAAVLANVELALEAVGKWPDDEVGIHEIAKSLVDARDATDRVRRIVRDLRVFTRSDDEPLGPVDVHHVLDSTLRIAWNEIRHRARLVKELEPVGRVHATESRLGQVFLNLLMNAAQAIAAGAASDHVIRVATRPAVDGGVVVEVEDSGPGMDAQTRAGLFEPFRTSKPAGSGTGLGLAICWRIVAGLGGTIAVDSAPGRGSTFRIHLPCSPASAVPALPPAPRTAPPCRRGRVLVVDDEPAIRAVLRRVLAEHEVVVVSCARDALERAGEPFDVILCDVLMPEITGIELYQSLLARAPETAARVVFLSGGVLTSEAHEFLESVGNLCVAKPFHAEELRALVRDRVR